MIKLNVYADAFSDDVLYVVEFDSEAAMLKWLEAQEGPVYLGDSHDHPLKVVTE